MGKGDKRTRRGKLFMGSFGNSRPHESKKTTHVAAPAKKAVAPSVDATAKKAPVKKERKPAAKKAKKE